MDEDIVAQMARIEEEVADLDERICALGGLNDTRQPGAPPTTVGVPGVGTLRALSVAGACSGRRIFRRLGCLAGAAVR